MQIKPYAAKQEKRKETNGEIDGHRVPILSKMPQRFRDFEQNVKHINIGTLIKILRAFGKTNMNLLLRIKQI